MKRITVWMLLMAVFLNVKAVLKEKDLDQTLSVLRVELTKYHLELTNQADERKQQNQEIIGQL